MLHTEYHTWFTSVSCSCDIRSDHLHFFEVSLDIFKCKYPALVPFQWRTLQSDGSSHQYIFISRYENEKDLCRTSSRDRWRPVWLWPDWWFNRICAKQARIAGLPVTPAPSVILLPPGMAFTQAIPTLCSGIMQRCRRGDPPLLITGILPRLVGCSALQREEWYDSFSITEDILYGVIVIEGLLTVIYWVGLHRPTWVSSIVCAGLVCAGQPRCLSIICSRLVCTG